VTQLDCVLAMVSTADSHAQQLRAGFVDLGAPYVVAVLADLRHRLDYTAKQLTSAREILTDCADLVQRDVIGTAAAPVPDPPPDPETTKASKEQPPAKRSFDWLLVRMLMAVAAFVLSVAVWVFDSWLHLVSIGNDLHQPALTVLLLGSVSVGHLDRYRTPRPAEVAVMQFFGVAYVSTVLITDLVGWRHLTPGAATAAIIVLALNAVVGVVVLPRHRGGRT
jgi:hypothetical protein